MPDDNAQTTKRSRLREILRTITGRKAAQQLDAQALRHTMVEDLIERNILHSEGLKSALRKVPRHEFIPHVTPAEAYRNYPIDTQRHGSVTTSCAPQPEVMTLMLEQLDPQPGHRILEIGAGTGYNAAIMSSITGDQGHVTSVDIEADITANARRALDENGYGAVNCQQADGWNGYPPDAPYDRIMSTVGVTEIPTAWLEQTTQEAIIVTPIQVRGFTMGAALQKRGHDLVSNSICHCTPLPIRGTRKTVIGHHTVGNSPSGPVQMTIAVDEGADAAAKDAADLLQEEMWLRQTEHPHGADTPHHEHVVRVLHGMRRRPEALHDPLPGPRHGTPRDRIRLGRPRQQERRHHLGRPTRTPSRLRERSGLQSDARAHRELARSADAHHRRPPHQGAAQPTGSNGAPSMDRDAPIRSMLGHVDRSLTYQHSSELRP